MELALIIGGSVIAALLVIAFAVWAHQYTKVGPNEVLIISGRRSRRGGYRIVRGGGTYVRPFRERVQRLSLELMQFDVRTGETYSMHGVPVQADGVCMVKIDGTDEGVERAAEQFLSRRQEDIVRTAMQAVEGHMRSAIGGLSIEDIYRDRQRLVQEVRDLAQPDLERMGLTIVSLTIRNVGDKQGYIEALGRPRTRPATRPTSPSSSRGATARSRRPGSSRRDSAPPPRRTSPTSSRRRSRRSRSAPSSSRWRSSSGGRRSS
jgi:flotillin